MKNLIFAICLMNCFALQAQFGYQTNNFEINNDLDVTIDSFSMDTLWQIGVPQKLIFDKAYSIPNALVTDTINHYPINQSASFTLELNSLTTQFFPYTQIEWWQKTDMELGVDGGIIEVSYDDGQSWSNVFSDPDFRPGVITTNTIDTLFNGQVGFTGSNDWSYINMCWGDYVGEVPQNVVTILARFTFVSDSVDTMQEGWLIDNFETTDVFIGATSSNVEYQSIPVFPNPASTELVIDFRNVESNPQQIQLFNTSGQLVYAQEVTSVGRTVYPLNISHLPSGLYLLIIAAEEERYQQKIVKEN